MAQRILLIGAGPAAAAAALACLHSHSQAVELTVLDVGGQLEQGNQDALERLSRQKTDKWAKLDVDVIRKSPAAVATNSNGLVTIQAPAAVRLRPPQVDARSVLRLMPQ